MRSWLAELLVEPDTGEALRLETDERRDGATMSGRLINAAGTVYPIINGIPRFVDVGGSRSSQVGDSFGYKWSRRSSYESPDFAAWYTRWLLDKYGFLDTAALRGHFARFERVLEVGCGGGMSAVVSLDGLRPDQHWVGIDLSSAIDIAAERLGGRENAAFVQADLAHMPFRCGSFDAIFSEGVIHHTPSTRSALESLVEALAPGGEIMFYVYRVKAPIRELADDHIREQISALPPEDAWRIMGPLTGLAKALSDLHATVDIPEDVPLLGIAAGTHDVQRLVYWHFAKLFWSDDLGFEGSRHVNFDWYHPKYANRHTQDEIQGWCDDLGLSIVHLDAQESGFTVRAIKG